MKSTVVLTILLLVMSPHSSAVDVIERELNGEVNWTQGYIIAHGYGYASDDVETRKRPLLAERAAKVVALRNLLEIVQGVRVTSETKVADLMLVSDTIKTRVEGVIKGALLESSQFDENSGISVVSLKLPIDGMLYQTLTNSSDLLATSGFEQIQTKIAQLLHRTLDLFTPDSVASNLLIESRADYDFAQKLLSQPRGNEELRSLLEKEIATFETKPSFSGLLIDARKVSGFQPATIARIRSKNGDLIYPKEELFEGYLSSVRPVSYDASVDSAILNQRVANTPLVVHASSVYKSRFSDLVIGDSDIELIKKNPALLDALNKAGVMIVISP